MAHLVSNFDKHGDHAGLILMVFKLMMETLSDTPKIFTTVYAHNNRALLLVQKSISSAGI